MEEFLRVQVPSINKYLKHICEEGELNESMLVSEMEIITQHGAIQNKTQTKLSQFYNLDAIISVGYRVNSSRTTQFLIMATKVMKDYIKKGLD